MSTIVITTKSAKNKDLYDLLTKQLGDTMTILSEEETEDMALGTAMNKGRTGKMVSATTVLNKLRAK
jgi:hypothetical protein